MPLVLRLGQDQFQFLTEARDFPVHSVKIGFCPAGTGLSCREYSSRNVKLITHLRLMTKLRMLELYLHSLIRLYGVLNYLIKRKDELYLGLHLTGLVQVIVSVCCSVFYQRTAR
jgi:hypothetical protein